MTTIIIKFLLTYHWVWPLLACSKLGRQMDLLECMSAMFLSENSYQNKKNNVTENKMLESIINKNFYNYPRILNKIPGGRYVFYSILGFISPFDRLHLYFYHPQNLTYYSRLLLETAKDITEETGGLTQ